MEKSLKQIENAPMQSRAFAPPVENRKPRWVVDIPPEHAVAKEVWDRAQNAWMMCSPNNLEGHRQAIAIIADAIKGAN